ncbi:hypothetical protein AB0I28_05350 [Phytomonospora sp. NPDC050363]|uniref:hypothetical protein n=1 Tax=Phytomonospora sp. NPDC050363 TaxID=3155642 RepID=UPI0033C47ADB
MITRDHEAPPEPSGSGRGLTLELLSSTAVENLGEWRTPPPRQAREARAAPEPGREDSD